jgi:hypothetical protein
MLGKIQDHPGIVTWTVVSLVVLHAIATGLSWVPNVWQKFLAQEASNVLAIYLGASASAAIVAGFAGVVVIYGLTAPGDRFRRLRLHAGDTLGDNWTSTSVVGFIATGSCLLAAILHAVGAEVVGPWLLELSILLLVHGTIRIIWLLQALMGTSSAQDREDQRRDEEIDMRPSDFS